MPKASLSLKDDPGQKVEAQFNPDKLRLSYRATGTTGSQRSSTGPEASGSDLQRTGFNTTLNMELLFDTSTEDGKDVRTYTQTLADMIKQENQNQAPLVQFSWGTFLFVGTIDSLDEAIDFFSDQGVPLRATVTVNMSAHERDRIQGGGGGGSGAGAGAGAGLSAGFNASAGFSAGISAGVSAGISGGVSASISAGAAVGTTPLTLAQAGDTLQGMAARAGVDWKAVASANNIDSPRLVQPGTVLNLNVGAGARIS